MVKKQNHTTTKKRKKKKEKQQKPYGQKCTFGAKMSQLVSFHMNDITRKKPQ